MGRGLTLTLSMSSSPHAKKVSSTLSFSRALGSCICIMFRPNPTAWIWLARRKHGCSYHVVLARLHYALLGPVRRRAGLREPGVSTHPAAGIQLDGEMLPTARPTKQTIGGDLNLPRTFGLSVSNDVTCMLESKAPRFLMWVRLVEESRQTDMLRIYPIYSLCYFLFVTFF